jgi:H+-translocating NAD(P) transhydrogenase subunit alpha
MCPSKDGRLAIDLGDEIIRGATVVHAGTVTWPPPAPKLAVAPPPPVATMAPAPPREPAARSSVSRIARVGVAAAAALALAALGQFAPPAFMTHFTVFVLACFVGYMVIWNVTPALHTPLMSLTNAISSIIVIGALLQISSASRAVAAIAAVTIAMASVNITGGFGVTRRMLDMFRK